MHTVELADGVFILYGMEDVFGEMKVKGVQICTTCDTVSQHEEASELLRNSYDDNESLKIAALEDYNKFHAQ